MATDNVTPIRSAEAPTVSLAKSFLNDQRRELYRALAVLTITAESLDDELADHRLALLVARDMIDAVNDRLDGAMVAASAEGRSHE